jgi:RNA polymerase sigma-70 factor (ECF subfamily)
MTGRLLRFRGAASRAGVDDKDLLVAFVDGDSSAIDELFRRHGDRVYRLLYRLRGVDADDIEDLVQATFLEVQRSASRFDHRASVGTWIFGIALNIWRHHVRSEKRRHSFLDAAAPIMGAATARGPDEQVQSRQFVERLEAGLGRLPEHLRIVVTLCDVEGLRSREVARMLAVPEGTVWRRLHQARVRLRVLITGRER